MKRVAICMSKGSTGGFEEKWTSNVEEYECHVCLLVAREAVACACGALFCEVCRAGCKSCPNCRSPDPVAPSFRDRRAILNLTIRCSLGCSVVFRLGDHSAHVRNNCVNRSVPCPLCRIPTTLSQHSIHMDNACAYRQVSCEACKMSVSLHDLPQHQQEVCPTRHVKCLLCSASVRLNTMEEHLKANGHMQLMLDRLMQLEQKVQAQQVEILTLRASKPVEVHLLSSGSSGPVAYRPHAGAYMVCGSGGCTTHEQFLHGHCDHLKRVNGNKPIGLWSCCGVLDRSVTTCGPRSLVGMYPLFSWR